jgi:hypothetical protein
MADRCEQHTDRGQGRGTYHSRERVLNHSVPMLPQLAAAKNGPAREEVPARPVLPAPNRYRLRRRLRLR